MAGITLAQAEASLTLWQTALDAIATGQSYTIGDRSLTRANLKDAKDMVTFWDNKVQSLTRGGIRIRGITPTG